MDISQLALTLLNSTGLRESLRKNVPVIDKLESLDSLKSLKLTGMNIEEEAFSFGEEYWIDLHYKAIAAQDFYPHTRTRLIELGIVKKYNVRTRTEDIQMDFECESLSLAFEARHLNISLKVYSPNYAEFLRKNELEF